MAYRFASCPMARPTVHRTGSRRLLADKTGFDPRHRVSSVIFRVVPRPLWSSRPAGVRASRSLAKDHFIYDNYSPLRIEFVLELCSRQSQNFSRLKHPRFDVRSAETISVPPPILTGWCAIEGIFNPARLSVSTYSRPGGAQLPASSVSPDLSPDRGHVFRR